MSRAAGVDRTTDGTRALQILLGISSIVAGLIHVAVVREHLSEGWVFGVFFILAAGFQISWAVAVLFERSTIISEAGAVTNGAFIGIWIVSRTIGLPVGPHTWMPETVRALDVTATMLELLLVVGSLVLVRRREPADGHYAGRDRLGKEDRPCV